MTQARIYVMPQVLKNNLEQGRDDPPIVLDLGYHQVRGQGVEITDESGRIVARVVYKKRDSDNTGEGNAQVWVEGDVARMRVV